MTKTRQQEEALIAAAPDLLVGVKFLMSQVEKLAHVYMSEDAAEWLDRNDAMNCGKRAIAKAEGTA